MRGDPIVDLDGTELAGVTRCVIMDIRHQDMVAREFGALRLGAFRLLVLPVNFRTNPISPDPHRKSHEISVTSVDVLFERPFESL